MVPVATGKAFVFVRCFSLFEESEKFIALKFQAIVILRLNLQ